MNWITNTNLWKLFHGLFTLTLAIMVTFVVMAVTFISALVIWPFAPAPRNHAYNQWHDWWAWRPVAIDDEDITSLVWLKTVRRIRYGGPLIEYKLK